MSYEIAKEYIANIGEENITAEHLQEWYDKLSVETDTLKKRFIRDHITVISNVIHSRE
jgi:hypothetical protein